MRARQSQRIGTAWRVSRRACLILFALTLGLISHTALTSGAVPAPVAGAEPVAQAVFFYSPACPHCHELIDGQLPVILDQYGGRLALLSVDASTPAGRRLFRNAVNAYDVPAYLRGVPALVIGNHFLAGANDISGQLPQLATQYLGQGGVGWPAIRGVRTALAASDGAVVTSSGRLIAATARSRSLLDRLAADRWGNTLALIILAGMLAAVGVVAAGLVTLAGSRRRHAEARPAAPASGRRLALVTVGLLILGAAISAYLSVAHATASATLCGPVGNCDAVQQSAYATLSGLVPVAYLGLAAYAVMGIAYAVSCLSRPAVASVASWAFFVLALVGTLFSIYLTVLEPFVIGASCIWCLGSAVTTTVLLLIAAHRLGLLHRERRQAGNASATAGRSKA